MCKWKDYYSKNIIFFWGFLTVKSSQLMNEIKSNEHEILLFSFTKFRYNHFNAFLSFWKALFIRKWRKKLFSLSFVVFPWLDCYTVRTELFFDFDTIWIELTWKKRIKEFRRCQVGSVCLLNKSFYIERHEYNKLVRWYMCSVCLFTYFNIWMRHAYLA